MYFYTIKAISDISSANIILNRENLKAFLLWDPKQDKNAQFHHFYSTLYQKSLQEKVLQEEEIKGIQVEKEEVKLSLVKDTRSYIQKVLKMPPIE